MAFHSQRVAARFFAALATTVIATSIGCGDRGLGIVPVSGSIAFPEGQTPQHGTVYFRPKEVAEGLPTRPASGNFTSDGVFHATSYDPDDGLVPGAYSVLVECFQETEAGWRRAEFPEQDVVVELESAPIVLEFTPESINYRPYHGA